ncbi:hypothetical protein AB0I82_00020 [Streptomyces sp. NPDC050315]
MTQRTTEQQRARELQRTAREQGDELAAARGANRELMAQLNRHAD